MVVPGLDKETSSRGAEAISVSKAQATAPGLCGAEAISVSKAQATAPDPPGLGALGLTPDSRNAILLPMKFENEMSRNLSPAEMAEALRQHPGRLIVTAHVRPDGDALGAALGLALGLRAGGLDAVCVGVEPIGTEYAFLDGVAEIVSASDYAPRESDRMVVVDCGDFSRIPEGMRGHAQKRIGFCIDHHKSNAGFAPLRLIEPTASSSAELVLSVLESGAFPVTRAAAEALWVGVVTDTGRFSYSRSEERRVGKEWRSR